MLFENNILGIGISFSLFFFILGGSSIKANQNEEKNRIDPQTTDVFTQSDNIPLPVLNDDSTIDDYLAYAALNNPKLKAAFGVWKAALHRIPQVRSLPDPKFNYAYFIREVETRVGAQEQKLGLSQMFPWFGKLQLKEDIAYEAANSAEQRYEAEKLKTLLSSKAYLL